MTPAGSADRDLAYRGFRTAVDLSAGIPLGVRMTAGRLTFDTPVRRISYTDPHTGHQGDYELARWTSPPVLPGFDIREVIPSWTAGLPDGCWVEVQLRGHSTSGPVTRWYTLARWAENDDGIRRTSVPDQRDQDATVDTDTLRLRADRAVPGWQLRVNLLRPAGSALTPAIHSVGGLACGTPAPTAPAPATEPAPGCPAPAAAPAPATPASATPDRTGPANGLLLDVPRFSQRVHAGHYPQWDGGGDSWCSPTSTSMVLAFWGTGPTPEQYAWVDPDDPCPAVDHAARQCFDHAYAGTGNWSFNTAYAGRYGMDAFVTRLRSLTEAERFIAAGLPLVLSAAYRAGDVPGLDYDTRGHLVVLVGFTADGDPVLNDPYSRSDEEVRKRVDRTRFESAWQTGSGGITYVIRPPDVPLPAAPAQPNW